ncbi:MAG: hypothetical protein HN377_03305 [Alphaproteobacteria bacterium]|nr:hypothetical protein [Alphaproteobacteria bacterium]
MAYHARVFAYHSLMYMRGITKLTLRLAPALLLGGLVVFGAAGVSGAMAEMSKPLPAKDCQRLRLALEGNLPFGPGFRRLSVKFPKNSQDIEGHVCRLLTMGTGAHMEGFGIASLKDMRGKVYGALTAAGLAATPDMARFNETSKHGREVFALYKDNAMCVTTIVVGVVPGVTPGAGAMKDGKVRLSKLKPHQREWWISIDCFTLPAKAQVEAVIEDVVEDVEKPAGDALPDPGAEPSSEFDLPEDPSGVEGAK